MCALFKHDRVTLRRIRDVRAHFDVTAVQKGVGLEQYWTSKCQMPVLARKMINSTVLEGYIFWSSTINGIKR